MLVKELKSILINLDPKYDNLKVVLPVYNLANDKTEYTETKKTFTGIYDTPNNERVFLITPATFDFD